MNFSGTFEFTQAFKKKAQKMCQKDPGLTRVLAKQFRFFESNPLHPSLKLHKLTGDRSTQYAIWIKGDLRGLAIKTEEKFIFFDLVSHKEY